MSTTKASRETRQRAAGAKAPADTAASRLPGLRRLLRQDESDAWAVRLLPRVVFGVAAVYTVFSIASQSGSAFVAICALALFGVLIWLLRRRTQLLLALGTTTLTIAFTGYFAAVGDLARTNTSVAVSDQAAFGYWALSGMALLGAWMVKEHPGRRGVTVLLADVILVIASAVGMFLPEVGVPVGFLGVIGVLAARGGTAKSLAARARRLFARRSAPDKTRDTTHS